MKKIKNPYYSTFLEKGLTILRLFSKDHPAWSLTEIAQGIRTNKTSAFRFVNTFVQLGYLKKHPQTKLISLGPQVIALALAFSQTNNLSDIGKPFIDEVCQTHDLTVELALFEESMLVVVYRRDARDAPVPRLPLTRGTMERFYCSSLGKAVLAHLPSDELTNILKKLSFFPRTSHTISNRRDLMTDLQKTKKRGYALTGEEWIPGLAAIGAPVLNLHTDEVLGAVCFDFLAPRSSMEVIERKHKELLLKLARDISQAVTIQN